MKKLNKILCLLLLILLSGCSLAKQQLDEENSKDVFVGVMLTNDYLGNKKLDEENRLFADIKKNKDKYDYTFEFKEIDGFDTFNYCYPNVDKCKSNYMTSSIGKEGLYNEENHLSINDNGDELTITTNMYFNHTLENKVFHINNIYETHDGKIYVSPGSGRGFDSYDSVGNVGSTILSESYESTEKDGRNYKMKITVQFNLIHTPDYFNIIEMNENHQVIHTKAIKNNEIPDEFIPDQNTSYLIFEQVSYDAENNIVKERKSINKEDKEIKTFTCRDDGICMIDPILLMW